MSKTCTKCFKEKPASEYYKNGKGGFHTYCRSCHKLDRLLYKYDLSKEEYAEMHTAQDYKCAVCGTTDPGGRAAVNSFMVDHNHETGKVRGLLCHTCNLMLGHAKDDSARLRRAADYLDHHDQRRHPS